MRLRIALGIGLLAVLSVVPPAAAVTTTIGQVTPAGMGDTCSSCMALQLETDPMSPSWVVPATPASGSWTVTSWSARGDANNGMDGHAQLQIWRPTGNPGEYRLISMSDQATIPQDAAPPNPTSLPVQPGDAIGLMSIDNIAATNSAPSVADKIMETGFANLGETMSPGMGSDHMGNVIGGARVNASAVLTAPDPVSAITTAPATTAAAAKKRCAKKKGKRRRCRKHKKK